MVDQAAIGPHPSREVCDTGWLYSTAEHPFSREPRAVTLGGHVFCDS